MCAKRCKALEKQYTQQVGDMLVSCELWQSEQEKIEKDTSM